MNQQQQQLLKQQQQKIIQWKAQKFSDKQIQYFSRNFQEQINNLDENIKLQKLQTRLANLQNLYKNKKQKQLDYFTKKTNEKIEQQTQKIQNNILQDLKENQSVQIDDYVSKNFMIDLMKKIQKKHGDQRYFIRVGNTSKPISDITLQKLQENVEQYNEFSNLIFDENKKNQITIFKPQNTSQIVNKKNGFFQYLHNSDFDFEHAQIYKQFNSQNYNDNCLIHCLKNAYLQNEQFTFTEEQINQIKVFVKDRYLPQNKLGQIAELLNIRIMLYKCVQKTIKNKLYNNLDSCDVTYNKHKKDLPILKIASLDDHCFIYLQNFNGKMSNLKTLKLMLDNNELTKIEQLQLDQIGHSIDPMKLESLSYNENSLRQVQKDKYEDSDNENEDDDQEEQKQNINNIVHFGDFETFLHKKLQHEYQLVIMDENLHNTYVYEFQSIDQKYSLFMRYIFDMYDKYKNQKTCIHLYFHNLKFDSCFLEYKYVSNLQILQKDNQIYYVKFQYKNLQFYVKDTLKHLNFPLKNFNKELQLGQNLEKEILPYEQYNLKSITQKWISFDKFTENLSQENKQHVLKNVQNTDMYNNKKQINILLYSRMYCIQDVKILALGFNKWRQTVKDLLNYDILEILTSSSLAHKFFINQNVYDGCYQLNQAPQIFIEQSNYGGRCMLNNNEKQYVKGQIQDFDAVSLYPSAMKRLGEIGGYLKGKPKILQHEQLNMHFLNQQDGYFIQILIKKINKKLDFPLIPIRLQNELKYTNDMENQQIIVNKFQLEDLIQYQNIEYDILKGYYFNEGRNPQILTTIQTLFQQRLQYKKEGKDSLQQVIKLLMNSSYGKCLQKTCNTKQIIFNDEKEKNVYKSIDNYLYKNYEQIKSCVRIQDTDKYIITKYQQTQDQFQMCHISSEILSMSKRIMSEIMCLAQDNGIKIYYQDTDSMHILNQDIEKLAQRYYQKYNRELIGKNMGQFHSDFSHAMNTDRNDKVYSQKFIGLGKKCYIDEVICEKQNGDKHLQYHIRMKGIPEVSITHYSQKNKLSITEIYDLLYKGQPLKFDLTCNQQRPKFDISIKQMIIEQKLEFNREIKF